MNDYEVIKNMLTKANIRYIEGMTEDEWYFEEVNSETYTDRSTKLYKTIELTSRGEHTEVDFEFDVESGRLLNIEIY